MSATFPIERFRCLDDTELVRLLVDDPVARIDVVEFVYREHGEALMAVAIAVVRDSAGACRANEYDELASIVIGAIAELLEYGARPHPVFRAVANGEAGAKLDLVPYLKQIVRNKIRQEWRHQARHRAIGQRLQEEDLESNILYPDFERRSDLDRIRAVITGLRLSGGERAIADVYLEHFPDRPEFQALCGALPSRSEKGCGMQRRASCQNYRRSSVPERPMDPEPADADARAALEHAGDRLLSELSAMRGNVDSDEGAALDPKAKRALAGCAKSFLDDLESRRRAMGEKEPRPRRAAVRWMRVAAVGVAAGGVALAAAAYDAGQGGRMPSLPRS